MRGLYDGCEPEQQAQSMKQGIVREASSPASRHRGSPPYSEQPRRGSTPASARRGHTPRSLVSLDAAMRPRASGTPISQRWPTPPSTTSRRNSSRPFSSRGQQSLVRPTGAFRTRHRPACRYSQKTTTAPPFARRARTTAHRTRLRYRSWPWGSRRWGVARRERPARFANARDGLQARATEQRTRTRGVFAGCAFRPRWLPPD